MGLPLRPEDLANHRGIDPESLRLALARSRTLGTVNLPSQPADASQVKPAPLAKTRQKRSRPQSLPKVTGWAARVQHLAGAELPPGTEIVRFRVGARPRPWTVPNIRGKRTCKRAPLAAWQADVAVAARAAMDERPAYRGHVKILLKFAFVPAKNGSEPDWTNVAKSTEDALQGIVIGNDRKCVKAYVEKWESYADYAIVRVVACKRLIERRPT